MRTLLMRAAGSVAAGCVLGTLAGCYGTIAKRTEDFSVKAAPALVEARGMYSLVEAVHARQKREEAIARYDSTAFDKVSLEARFGSERDLKARMAVIDLLQNYLVALGEVSGDKPLKDIDAPSETAAKAVTSIAKNDLPALLGSTASVAGATSTVTEGNVTTTITTTTAPPANPVVSAVGSVSAGDAAKAIDAIGRVLVERRRARELPGILESADKPVRTLCELLRRDIGDPATAGLRYQLRNDYRGIEIAEDAAIRDHPQDYRYPEKHQAVDALYSLVTEQAASDAALVETDKALEAFETTHTALVRSARQKRAPGFRALLAELSAEGEQLSQMETTMTNGSGSKGLGSKAGGSK